MADQVTAPKDRVEALKNAGVLRPGVAEVLKATLNLKGNAGDVRRVRAFLRAVRALRRKGKLSAAKAKELLQLGKTLLLSVTRQ